MPSRKGKSAVAAEGSGSLPGDTHVVRGDKNTAQTLRANLATHPEAGVMGVSVESAAQRSVEELSRTLPHRKIGTTTVREVRAAGGDVEPTKGRSPHHATMTGLSVKEMSELLQPPIPNPRWKE